MVLQSMRDAFGSVLYEIASDNPNIYVVSADLASSVGLEKFSSRFKTRFVECGIAESNAAAIAAGIAHSGKTVFLVSYACFSPALNWGVIRQSICYNQSNVKIIGSHAGLTSNSDSGATHQMLEDIALARALPGLDVFAPVDANEAISIIKTSALSPRPAYIRLVRPETPIVFNSKNSFTIGKSQVLQTGSDVTILGYGPVLAQAVHLEGYQSRVEVINCSSIKPLDEKTILGSLQKTGKLIVIEDHQQSGGLGEAVSALILKNNLKCRLIHLAINDQFGQSSKDYQTLYNHYGISDKHLIEAVKSIL